MRAAREACDEVVVSLFVNPAQFEEAADLAAYPRTEAGDAAIAARARRRRPVRPARWPRSTPAGSRRRSAWRGSRDVLEGAERGAGPLRRRLHRRRASCFNIVAPDVAFFGQKDAQQVVVIAADGARSRPPRRLAVVATVREPDGLALSSRNARLGAGRPRARASR